MPFIRLSDNYIDHPKFIALSADAFRLWHEGLAFCRRHQTDGVIPGPALRGFRYFKPGRVKELTTAYMTGAQALWQPAPDGGYVVHDYLEWNLSREEEEADRRQSAERTRRWRMNKAGQKGEPSSGQPGGSQNQASADVLDASSVTSPVRDASRDARVPDRIGSEAVTEGVQGKPADDGERLVPMRRRFGAMAGELPRDHLTHAACSPNFAWCVPAAVHAKLRSRLLPAAAGDAQRADAQLRAWYAEVWAGLPAGFVAPDDAFRFWGQRFDAKFASLDPVTAVRPGQTPAPVSNVPSAAATRRTYLDN